MHAAQAREPRLTSEAQHAVSLRDVSVVFTAERGKVRALDGINFDVEEGSFLTMIGPSGSGKSTILRVVADLIKPSTGTVQIFGRTAEDARRRRELGFVFQDATLLPWRSVLDNVRLPLEIGRRSRGEPLWSSPEELLALVGLEGRHNSLPHELSGGMRQRVAIARALVCRPRLLLMDEPFGALDEITRDKMNEELLRIWRETKTTIMFVTHSIPEAVYLGQQVLVLSSNPGRVREQLTINLPNPRELRSRDEPEFVRFTSQLRSILETC